MQIPELVITLDSRVNCGFNATYKGQLFHFSPYENGLYYYDTRMEAKRVPTKSNKSKTIVSPYSLLQFVEDNKQFYTQREIKGAKTACLQQVMISTSI